MRWVRSILKLSDIIQITLKSDLLSQIRGRVVALGIEFTWSYGTQKIYSYVTKPGQIL